ncbi:hypothetical protein EV129_101329 [Rhizobium azibense]|uniref:Uncharacterized protein n=1 Tax=Rhizobium azibense TaxID=1136135 RepID=A0A4R3S318_9HYPH|nr:hypothetical protein EV129_101329 [Rhizobium azibense]
MVIRCADRDRRGYLDAGASRQEDGDGYEARAVHTGFLQQDVDLAEHIAGLDLNVRLSTFCDLAGKIDETHLADGLARTRTI